MRMEPREDPMAFTIQVECAKGELEDLGVFIDEKTFKVQIITGLINDYENERRNIDSKKRGKLTMEKGRTITAQGCDIPHREKEDGGGITLAALTATTFTTVRRKLRKNLGKMLK